MAIYAPQILLSDDDKELLHLLAELILSSQGERMGNNYPAGYTVLSNDEAMRLIDLLEQFVESRKFIEGAYLIEQVFNRGANEDPSLRDLYLTWKARGGRSRAMATAQWHGFLARLGIEPMTPSNGVWYRSPVQPMPFEYFFRMEERLSRSAKLSPRVRSIILSFVREKELYVESIRNGQNKLSKGQISDLPRRLLQSISRQYATRLAVNPLPTSQIIGATVIVMDFASIFTTRDWDASGFISSVAGAAPALVLKPD